MRADYCFAGTPMSPIRTVDACLRGPGDLHQILDVAFDERPAFERLFTTDRPSLLDRPRFGLQTIAMRQR